MGNLVLTVIGIAMFSLFLLSGSNSISYDGVKSATVSDRISSSVIRVSGAIYEYHSYIDEYPEKLSDLKTNVISRLPKVSPHNFDGTNLEGIAFDEDYEINADGKNVFLCLGSNKISSVEILSLAKAVDLLGSDKVLFYTSCESSTSMAVNNEELVSGNYESLKALASQGDSLWIKYNLVGVNN